VTWRARHFGIKQKLTTKITAYDRPFHFRDEQIKGVFKKIKHDHYFEVNDDKVLMTDKFLFESPFGILGDIFNKLILTKYLKAFLIKLSKILLKATNGNSYLSEFKKATYKNGVLRKWGRRNKHQHLCCLHQQFGQTEFDQ